MMPQPRRTTTAELLYPPLDDPAYIAARDAEIDRRAAEIDPGDDVVVMAGYHDAGLGRYVEPRVLPRARDPDPAITADSLTLRAAEVNGWPEPEDRADAVLSLTGSRTLVDDLITAGRILVMSGEEGTGKSFATLEVALRVAAGEGTFAGTWPIVRNGPVLYLSEMHPDDDFDREETILTGLGIPRSDLRGRYFRLPLMTAAGATPALMSAEWRAWAATWMRAKGVVMLVVDTATGATQVNPWGAEIQQVYRSLRLMLEDCPDLAIVLLLHMRKASGPGARGISAVLGEWGRWCDVVLMMENDGDSLERVKLTSRKRVRNQRRILATKRDGLLVDAVDLDNAGPKVPNEEVLAAIEAEPGITYAELGRRLGVSKDTVTRYVKTLGDLIDASPTGARGAYRLHLTAAPPQTAAHAHAAVTAADQTDDRRTAARTYIGAAVRAAAVPTDAPVSRIDCRDYSGHQTTGHRRRPDGSWGCTICSPVAA